MISRRRLCLLFFAFFFSGLLWQAFENNEGMLLHGGDIFGYLLALTADKYGRNYVQAAV